MYMHDSLIFVYWHIHDLTESKVANAIFYLDGYTKVWYDSLSIHTIIIHLFQERFQELNNFFFRYFDVANETRLNRTC